MNYRDKIMAIAADLRTRTGAAYDLAGLQRHTVRLAGELETAVQQLAAIDVGAVWKPDAFPPALREGEDRVQVLAVIDDPRYADEPFVDIVTYWRGGRWTVTHHCRGDHDATDHEVRIRCHKELDAVPEGVSWA